MHKQNLRVVSTALVLIVLGGLGSAAAPPADIITGGGLTDAQFQALVDSASPGDTILCSPGLYSFSGPVRIDKSLSIVAEDPSDPPIFQGTGVFGTPYVTGNNGFMVLDLQSDIDGLEFEGLQMRDFDRAFAFSPSAFGGSGVLKNLRVANSHIENSRRGMQNFFGPLENFDFVGNTVDVQQAGILIFGDGSKGGTVQGNDIAAGRGAIRFLGAEDAMVLDNQISNGLFGVWLTALDDDTVRLGSIINNSINSGFGIVLNGQTSVRASSASGNTVAHTIVGLLMESGANGFLVANNEFSGSGFVDIWLGGDADGFAFPPAAHDNTVVATDFQTTYVDNGIDNRLVGTLAMIENPGVPPAVEQMLVDLRAELAAMTE